MSSNQPTLSSNDSAPSRGRPNALDADKRKRIIALLEIGCSRRVAARCVGCAPTTITRTAARVPEFADEVARAESNLELHLLNSIRKAANSERYWHAAAWLLERKYPLDYMPRQPQLFTIEQLAQFVHATLGILREEITPAQQEKVIHELDALLAQFDPAA